MKHSLGLSLIGILLGLAAGSILLAALVLLVGREFGISREQTEQVRITEDARLLMERVGDAIRDARSRDGNGDSLATFPLELWLQYGDSYDIQFYTNLDTDDALERIHYFLEGTELKRGVRDPYTQTADQEQVAVVAKSLRNMAAGVPLFRYYPKDGSVAVQTPVAAAGEIERVEISLVVDVDETQAPAAAMISTVVSPRASQVLFVSPE